MTRHPRPLAPALLFSVVAILLALVPVASFAASTGTTVLPTAQGSGAATSQGDYVTSDGALDENYQLWIEVPPGLSRLVVQIFDPDIGRGGGGDATANRDRARGSYDTDVDYVLYDPGGTDRASLDNCDTNTCSDNSWQTLIDTTSSLIAGHWLLEVEMNSDETSGDDVNAFGVRAHDGTAGSGGTELNVYWDSYATYGTNNENIATFSRSYSLHPWVTAGCRVDSNDFDFDSSGTIAYQSRSGSFVYASSSPSGNDVWRNAVIGPWTTDTDATDYGVWTQDVTITGYPGNGNYGQVYLGNELAGNPPPSSQPEADTYRIYLPTDAGAAPVKPYVEQMVRWDHGPNPPQTGQTSTFTVTVRVVNPTPRAITFSLTGSHLVAASVPGGGVVYGGNAQTSQGGVVLQPAIGGTGLVVWNPGSLAAGATAIMSYEVAVTPTSNGQRLPVTATPASGVGTRAYFYDETGNTTQGRASYLFGPLCELAVTEGLLTHALLDDLRVYGDGGRQVVEWRTAGEAATSGFVLERAEPGSGRWMPIHEGILAAHEPQPGGAVYRIVDPAANPRHATSYRLWEIDIRGERNELGRITGEAASTEGPILATEDLEVTARRGVPRPDGGDRLATTAKKRPTPTGEPRLAVGVRETGLHFVSSAAIANAMSTSPELISRALDRGELQISEGRKRIASWPAGDLSGLFFYGEARHDLYSRETHYHLERGKARRPRRAAAPPGPTVDGFTFAEVRDYEVDRFAATVLPLAADSDYWFWEGMLGGHPTVGSKTFSLATPGVDPGAAGELTVRLQGANDDPLPMDHRVRALLGGHDLGTVEWDGITAAETTLEVPPGILGGDLLELELIAEKPGGVALSALYVDGFTLAYPRRHRAPGDHLLLRGDGATTVEVAGFSSPDLVLLELGDSRRPALVENWEIVPDGDTFTLRFAPRDATTPYWAGTRAAALTDADLDAEAQPRDLRSERFAAELLILAPGELLAGASRLAELRRQEGLAVEVIDTTDVYHTYGDGTATPQALQTFLKKAWHSSWRRLRWALLVGDGSFDYRDIQGFGDSVVPTRMRTTPSGIFAADALYGDLVGDDGVAELVIGRLPVQTASELEAVVDKLEKLARDAAPAAALFLADGIDGAASFAAASERVAARLGDGYAPSLLSLDELPLSTLRGQLFDALDTGAATVAYLGHGAGDRLAAEGLLTTADATALSNSRPFLLTAMTCTAARFEVPGLLSLGEALLLQPEHAAGGVWSMSSLIDHQAGEQLAAAFYAALSRDPEARLGELLATAGEHFLARGGDPEVLATAVLLGDPSARPRLAPPPPTPASAGVGE